MCARGSHRIFTVLAICQEANWLPARAWMHRMTEFCRQPRAACMQSMHNAWRARGQPAIFSSWQMARTVKMRWLPRAHIAPADARARAAGPGHYYDQIHRARPAADQYFGQQAGQMRRAR